MLQAAFVAVAINADFFVAVFVVPMPSLTTLRDVGMRDSALQVSALSGIIVECSKRHDGFPEWRCTDDSSYA